MEREKIDLLIKELCARQPYDLKVVYEGEIKRVDYVEPQYNEIKLEDFNFTVGIEEIQICLRPKCSMTEAEEKEYHNLCIETEIEDRNTFEYKTVYYDTVQSLDYLNEKMIDYRNLFDQGLAVFVDKLL